MTIDEADTILSCERLDSSMGCGASDEDIDKALGVAIDIMHKYQKIQEIVNSKTTRLSYENGFRQIKEVLEDDSNGNK